MHTLEPCSHCSNLTRESLESSWAWLRWTSMQISAKNNTKKTHYVPATRFVFAFCWLSLNILAMPKSVILGLISSSSKTLLALRSLWIIFSLESWWRYRSPLATPFIILNRVGQSSCVFLVVPTKVKSNTFFVNNDLFVLLNYRATVCYEIILKSRASKLLLGMYSKINSFSSPSMQQARNLTKFLCCTFAIRTTSFLNSAIPCSESLLSLLMATSCPSNFALLLK